MANRTSTAKNAKGAKSRAKAGMNHGDTKDTEQEQREGPGTRDHPRSPHAPFHRSTQCPHDKQSPPPVPPDGGLSLAHKSGSNGCHPERSDASRNAVSR